MPDTIIQSSLLEEIDRIASIEMLGRRQVIDRDRARHAQATALAVKLEGQSPGSSLNSDQQAKYLLDAEQVRIDALQTQWQSDSDALTAAIKQKYNLNEGDTYDLATGRITRL